MNLNPLAILFAVLAFAVLASDEPKPRATKLRDKLAAIHQRYGFVNIDEWAAEDRAEWLRLFEEYLREIERTGK